MPHSSHESDASDASPTAPRPRTRISLLKIVGAIVLGVFGATVLIITKMLLVDMGVISPNGSARYWLPLVVSLLFLIVVRAGIIYITQVIVRRTQA